jgi:hypothetical protein
MELKIKYEKNGKKPGCPRTYRNTRLKGIQGQTRLQPLLTAMSTFSELLLRMEGQRHASAYTVADFDQVITIPI